ncbi:hypothetical protein MIND_01019000 [Mycena indigotica]|uniref:Uncharacterized protein n=1 Tax=Mycena indigotica TaxID=2126181 RepID=A0A8H6VYE5_9AGAR|nr:uncharacterized protein MIND_01019000 [Mycena indigotica]KAF7294813.1 hypothetical protein MIND_01019000 [Mycena indigotica]
MYSDPNLDTPPPQSQFRRPWSPEPYDPQPSTHNTYNPHSRFLNQGYEQEYQPNYNYDHSYPTAPRRREASEVSVEALDLADYAMTLRAHQNNAYQSTSREMFYPPSPPAQRPFANRPPSTMSRMDTLSSNTHSSPGRGRNTSRRPFSLPPPSAHSHSSRHSQPTSPRSGNSRNNVYMHNSNSASRQNPRSSDPEIDIAQFPAWSRNWYNSKPAATSPPDIYTSLPPSSWSPRRAPFDNGAMFRPDTLPHSSSDFYDPYNHPASSLGHESTRDLLPWSSEPPDYGPMIDSSLKEERIRMLEREFGPNAKPKGPTENNGEFVDEDGKPLVGTVDSKGRLVTKGPRKRLALRMLQIVLSLTAAIPGIYAALAIKPKAEDKPPPSGSVAAYVLYVFSSLTVVLLLYLFLFRPCCCSGRRKKTTGPGGNPMANGMMVLPVSGLPGSKKKAKKAKRGKKGMPMPGGGDVQVNLIVDPNAFGGRPEDDDDTDDELDDDGGSVPGSFDPASARRKRKRAKRRSVFAGLAMEEAWKAARSWLKKITAVDTFGLILWGAVFIFILIGKRCPSGGFDGWCNAYNVSTAAACLLCVSFGIAIFFDVQDLSGSKLSPRTRT